MKIKIITSLGTFTSDELKVNTPEELFDAVNSASNGTAANFRMPINGCHTFFGEELIKNSVFKIIK